jgi:hypothetical protein
MPKDLIRLHWRHPFAAGVALGIVSSATILQQSSLFLDCFGRSDRDRMRADWLRVGGDIRSVIDTENAKAASSSR